jgi:16S rRNA G1207 methylase RsmC
VKQRRKEPALAAPSAAAFRALGPYARTRLVEKALGLTLSLDVPADVFSTQRIDDGTLLLLANLPAGAPRSFLDLGCGYGALGLPIAARYPEARGLLVDRDLLAVAAAAHNARALGLANVEVRPGLGYSGLDGQSFDWVLCNVPARIGERAIRYLLEAGRTLGEVRVVVIRDLMPALEPLAQRVAVGPRHAVYAVAAAPGRGLLDLDDDAVYARDQTRLGTLALERPHDASEDPAHQRMLLVLADALPREAPRSVLCFRAGYGALPLLAQARWPAARIVAQDRDLLDTAFLRRNARAHAATIEIRESLFLRDRDESFALLLGELSPSAGEAVAKRELQDAADLLAPGGQALVLLSEKMEREWLPKVAPRGASTAILLRREGACVLRISRSRG